MDIAVAGADLRLCDNARDVWRISLRVHRYAEMLPQKSPVGGIYGASVDGAQGKCYGSSCWQERDQYSIPFLVFNPSEEQSFMSVQTMAKVFEQSKSKLGDRLVLLALANHSDPNDINSYPAVETLAREAGLCERQVQRCLRRLEALGEIIHEGTGPHGTRRYRIIIGGDKLSGVTNCQGDKSDMGGVTFSTKRGDMGVTRTIINHPKSKPSSKRKDAVQEKRSPERGTRLPQDWIPSESERAWAEKQRPDLDLTAQAEGFADYWHAKPGKDGRKLDWSATWRNWIRNARGSNNGKTSGNIGGESAVEAGERALRAYYARQGG